MHGLFRALDCCSIASPKNDAAQATESDVGPAVPVIPSQSRDLGKGSRNSDLGQQTWTLSLGSIHRVVAKYQAADPCSGTQRLTSRPGVVARREATQFERLSRR